MYVFICQATLEVQGVRLNNTKEEKTSKMYGPDRRLDLVIVPNMPKLQVIIDKDLMCVVCIIHVHIVQV